MPIKESWSFPPSFLPSFSPFHRYFKLLTQNLKNNHDCQINYFISENTDTWEDNRISQLWTNNFVINMVQKEVSLDYQLSLNKVSFIGPCISVYFRNCSKVSMTSLSLCFKHILVADFYFEIYGAFHDHLAYYFFCCPTICLKIHTWNIFVSVSGLRYVRVSATDHN